MKQVYFIIAMLCGLALGGQAQGIRFAEGSWKELLETAKKEGKLIFVDCYTEWCQPCKQMEQQVFPSKKVGKFYNEHFINVKMDMEKGEGPDRIQTTIFYSLIQKSFDRFFCFKINSFLP